MAGDERRRTRWTPQQREREREEGGMVPLAALISRELRSEKMEKPCVRYGCAAQSKKGEDYFLIKTDCLKLPANGASAFSVFAIFDGHNGNAAAIYTKENLLNHVLGAIPRGLGREEWLQALPRALVAGFVKTDKEFQSKGQTSGTTVTFVIVDGWTVTVASVGDSRCILDTQGGVVSLLTVDHRLEENAEERERVTASGGEVGRLSIVGGAEEALRTRGLKDDTTCIVVDIIPPDISVPPPSPPKKQSRLKSLIFRKRSRDSANTLAKKLSAIGIVEELFEEGSAMLAERLGNDNSSAKTTSRLFTCAICQVDLAPNEGISVHAGSFFSTSSKPWQGPFLCADCRNKKDAMEGKRPSGVKVT